MKDLKPRILFIDAYDSFSNNIKCTLQEDLDVDVTEVKIDTRIGNLSEFVQHFAAIVVGPGPGHPANIEDVGLIEQLWKLSEECLLPVFGICLGFQSLVLFHGGGVEPLPKPRHGIVRTIRISERCSFPQGSLRVVQYHSLHASLGHSVSEPSQSMLWEGTDNCPDLVPLAWDYEDENEQDQTLLEWSGNPRAILMAVKHRIKPFCGVQFHPESICSDTKARFIVRSWWKEAQEWNTVHRRIPYVTEFSNDCTKTKADDKQSYEHHVNYSMNEANTQSSEMLLRKVTRPLRVVYESFAGQLTVPEICQMLRIATTECIVLDSERHQRPEVGRYSMIGLVDDKTPILQYSLSSARVTFRVGDEMVYVPLGERWSSAFDYIKDFMESRKAVGGNASIPFWGGLMGFISYEACLETINVSSTRDRCTRPSRPDMSFAFVERSVVVDHELQKIYTQSIRLDDHEWVQRTVDVLREGPLSAFGGDVGLPLVTRIVLPEIEPYKVAIRECQTAIHKGDSYELCLTTKASIRTDQRHTQPWPLFLRLRGLNPAPFSAYIRLSGLTLLSSSPERFLSWSRPSRHPPRTDTEISVCQFRPIKGTVKKQSHKGATAVSFAAAEKILSTPKEKAENLMIVDLIRHDLHGVAGYRNVRVSKLMVVEEYATLFQLVTVIEGDLVNPCTASSYTGGNSMDHDWPLQNGSHDARIDLAAGSVKLDTRHRKTGVDVLAASLPPGSMTGAPKKRSCQLLQAIEQHRPRGIYSGVVGYMDVGGGGDFSVVIRSAVRWDDNHDGKGDVWTVGAGGAVTSLSTEDGEWDEMLTKLKSTLRLFDSDC